MDRYLLHAAALTPQGRLPDTFIHLRNGHIVQLEPFREQTLPLSVPVIDASGLLATPGWTDLQVNGGFGLDFTQDPSAIWSVAKRLPTLGTTAFLPTIITAPPETVEHAIRVLRAGPPPGWRGARPLGLHLEGPFLNPGRKGAHSPAYLRLPNPPALASWTRQNGVLLATLAPELPGGMDAVAQLRRQGVVVSAGHSLASYTESQAAFAAGVRCATHLYNAMPPMAQREPGLVLAALLDPTVKVGLIADGLHNHPAMVELAWRLKGATGICLVSDAMAALGMPPGDYCLADQPVRVDNASARLADGTLAGSLLSQQQALRNVMEWCGANLATVIPALTSTPADLLGLHDRGRLVEGAVADLTLVDPAGEVKMVLAGGELLMGA
jgi:N-acetylglucosamine-6-phosphate deacetylase